MRANTKTAFRLIKKHIARLITIIAIVMVSIGFMSGVGEVDGKIQTATYDYYQDHAVSDLYLKTSSMMGFNATDISKVEEKYGAENVVASFCYETDILKSESFESGTEAVRIYAYDLTQEKLNKFDILEGNLPSNDTEILAERDTNFIKKFSVGDKVKIGSPLGAEVEYTISGIISHPMHIYRDAEQSYQEFSTDVENEKATRTLTAVFYMNPSALPSPIPSTMRNDMYITLSADERLLFENTFTPEYKELIETHKAEISALLGESVTALSLYENYGIYSLTQYASKVGTIGIVFVIFFLLVTLLVVYSTMSRLLAEERAQIACQKTLGISNFRIVVKYLIFVLIATLIGALLAFPVGYGLTRIVYSAFGLKYAMPAFPATLKFIYFLIVFAIILVATMTLTCITGVQLVRHKPATLLTPKAPKSGKKVFLEKLGFIWKHLSFKYKSTLRNVLLFKSRFFMTVISIIGATILVFCGLGIMDCATNIPGGESLKTIAAALIIFSALLCALVIYNLTNINVSERNREIATLMVLGYQDREVTGYIFREIYIMSFIGAILGLPIGVGFIQFVFGLIDFGTLPDITWHTYVLTPCIAMVFSFLSTLLLRRKITKTDMNASLKILE